MSVSLTLTYANRTQRRVLLIIEPWAEEYWVEPDDLIKIEARVGAPGGHFEVEHTVDGLIVHGWEGTMVSVLKYGRELKPSPQRIVVGLGPKGRNPT
jgi:hypothetical protein